MTQTFYDYMAIPEKGISNKTIFKKIFFENADLDATDKRALNDDVSKIIVRYSLEPINMNIQAYADSEREYLRIPVIEVHLKSISRLKRIDKFIHKSLFDPLVIVFSFADTIAISVADKRINQADKSKWVTHDAWITAWFNPDAPNEAQQKFMKDLTIKNLSFVNFYAFYTDIKNRIIALNTSDRSGSYSLTSGDGAINRAESLRELDKLEQVKAELQNKLYKEKQMGRQVEMTNKIKKYADQINGLKERL